MKVQKTKISSSSLIQIARPNSDFEECYSITFFSPKINSLEKAIELSFSPFSNGWINYLFRLRDWLVKPFNLKTAEDYNLEFPSKIEKGGTVGFFDVKDANDKEVLMYTEDSHLSAYFCISFLQSNDKKTLKSSTIVFLNNRLGKVYFFIIKPFHKLIIKRMLKHAAHKLSKH